MVTVGLLCKFPVFNDTNFSRQQSFNGVSLTTEREAAGHEILALERWARDPVGSTQTYPPVIELWPRNGHLDGYIFYWQSLYSFRGRRSRLLRVLGSIFSCQTEMLYSSPRKVLPTSKFLFLPLVASRGQAVCLYTPVDSSPSLSIGLREAGFDLVKSLGLFRCGTRKLE